MALKPIDPVPLSQIHPISDKEPNVTQQPRAMIQDAAKGKMRAQDYTSDFWNAIAPQQNKMQVDLNQVGRLSSITLVERWNQNDQPHYRYRADFENATLLQHFALDKRKRVAFTKSEDIEWK